MLGLQVERSNPYLSPPVLGSETAFGKNRVRMQRFARGWLCMLDRGSENWSGSNLTAPVLRLRICPPRNPTISFERDSTILRGWPNTSQCGYPHVCKAYPFSSTAHAFRKMDMPCRRAGNHTG